MRTPCKFIMGSPCIELIMRRGNWIQQAYENLLAISFKGVLVSDAVSA
jgi:hypothetical protein